ncbi:MAG: SOS response-associated peptidase [Deltaproteobacteria bacterium]|nr:SOS response-associated peptidase [Deltaproteobacteria bacterium]
MTLSTGDWVRVAEELLATPAPGALEALHPRFNVAPTQAHPIVVSEGGPKVDHNVLTLAHWGFPGKQQGPLVINARSETALTKPLFRTAFAQHRCVVVADGFIEWRKSATGRQPLWFRRKDGRPLYLAGLYLPGGATAKGSPTRFVVLTTSPNHLVAPVHDRMPAVLSPQDALTWLAHPAGEVLRPAPDAWLASTEISPRINNTANDDPACLEPATSTRQQLALF